MTAGAKGLDALWCKIRIQSEMNDGGKMIGWREREKKSGAQATTATTNVPAGPEKKYGGIMNWSENRKKWNQKINRDVRPMP